MTTHPPTVPFADATGDLADPASLRDRAARDGYLYLPGVLPTGPIHAARDAVLEEAQRQGWLDPEAPVEDAIATPGIDLGAHDDPRYFELLQRILPDPRFAALATLPEVHALLERLFDGAAEDCQASVCRVLSPDSAAHTTRPHQDAGYLDQLGAFWTTWIPLVECPRRLGPLALVPGSHNDGIRPHRPIDPQLKIAVTSPADIWASGDLAVGDVVLFDSRTVHRALTHRDPRRLRLSADFRFRPASAVS